MKLSKGACVGGVVLFLGSLFAACSDDAPATTGTPDGSVGTGDSAVSEDTGAQVDSSVDFDLDGGTILDGGDISPNDDGGLVDLDAGFDAGPACLPVPLSVTVASTCSSTKAIYLGGTIVAGSYNIESVTVHADATTCATTFKSANFRSAVEVVDNGKAGYVFRFAQIVGAQGGIGRAARYDLDAVPSVSSLTLTPKAPCVGNAVTRVASYSAGKGKDGKDRLAVTFPIGISGTATYRFVKP